MATTSTKKPRKRVRPIETLSTLVHAHVQQQLAQGYKCSAQAVAKAAGVSRATIYNWMAGVTAPSDADLDKLGDVLGKPVSKLRRLSSIAVAARKALE